MDRRPRKITGAYVSRGISVLFKISRIAGVAPLRFEKVKDWYRITPSHAWNVYGFILISVLHALSAAFHIVTLLTSEIKISKIIKPLSLWLGEALFIALISGTAVYSAPGHMRELITLLKRIHKTNNVMKLICTRVLLIAQVILVIVNLNQNRNTSLWQTPWSRNISILTVAKILSYGIFAIIHIFSMATIYSKRIDTIFFTIYELLRFCSYTIMHIRIAMFIAIVLHIKHVFKVINDEFEKLLESGNTHRTQKYIINLRCLFKMFIQSCIMVKDVDRRNGFIVILMITYSFIQLILTPYLLTVTTIQEDLLAMSLVGIAQLIYACIFYFCNMVVIIEPCDMTHVEVKRTRNIVFRLMESSYSTLYNPLDVELNLFYKFLLHNEVRYRPLRLITMTRSLVITILGSITTYLVIFLQL